ncbi:MAG: helix-turn-helix domain-containing protein [Oscillospiraceae bacterium]|nr:helix-turn-helix domain-containing protein [Oscillospiraceae bacterium]
MNENTIPVTLMTIHEAAQTGIMPENTLRRMCRNNEVPCLHVGKRTFINLNVLVEFLNNPDNYIKKSEKPVATIVR